MLQFTNSTLTKEGLINKKPFTYAVTVQIQNDVLTQFSINIHIDEATEQNQHESNRYIGHMRQDSGRFFSDFESGQNLVAHYEVFNDAIEAVKKELSKSLEVIEKDKKKT